MDTDINSHADETVMESYANMSTGGGAGRLMGGEGGQGAGALRILTMEDLVFEGHSLSVMREKSTRKTSSSYCSHRSKLKQYVAMPVVTKTIHLHPQISCHLQGGVSRALDERSPLVYIMSRTSDLAVSSDGCRSTSSK